MIEIQIRQRAESQGIKSAYQLQKELGISSPDVASRLWRHDFTRLDLQTLDRLCRVLKCQPNKILRYVIEENGENAA